MYQLAMEIPSSSPLSMPLFWHNILLPKDSQPSVPVPLSQLLIYFLFNFISATMINIFACHQWCEFIHIIFQHHTPLSEYSLLLFPTVSGTSLSHPQPQQPTPPLPSIPPHLVPSTSNFHFLGKLLFIKQILDSVVFDHFIPILCFFIFQIGNWSFSICLFPD